MITFNLKPWWSFVYFLFSKISLGFPTIKYFLPGARNFTAKNVVAGRTEAALRNDVLNLIVANEPKLPDVALGINFNDIANLSELEEFLANVKAAEKFKFVLIVIGLKSDSKANGN